MSKKRGKVGLKTLGILVFNCFVSAAFLVSADSRARVSFAEVYFFISVIVLAISLLLVDLDSIGEWLGNTVMQTEKVETKI